MRIPAAHGEWDVPDDLYAAYCVVRPDAPLEFAKMRIWLETHKSRRPRRPDLFIAAWFKRSRPTRPVTAAAHNKSVVMGAIFGKRQEVIDVEPATRRLG